MTSSVKPIGGVCLVLLVVAISGCQEHAVSPPQLHALAPATRKAIAQNSTRPTARDSLIQSLAALPVALVPPGKPTFDDLGAHAGDQLPAVPLKRLDDIDDDNNLQQIGGSTLLITSSLTCPKSRSMYPHVARLKAEFPKLSVVVIYIVEAHPKTDPSPYSGVEDVTDENRRENVLCRQPTTMEERLKLAHRFVELLHVDADAYVDGMDNAAWRALGSGPNMAFLIGGRGNVYYRQGWFDPKTMRQAIQIFLPAIEARQDRQSAGAHDPFKQIAGMDHWALAQLFSSEDSDISRARKVLDEHPELTKYVDGGPRGIEPKTLLIHAVENKRRVIAELLLDRGADPNQPVRGMAPVLYVAARVGDPDIVRLLLRHGAAVNGRLESLGPKPLQEALIHRNFAAAAVLRQAGAESNFFTQVASGEIEQVRQRLQADSSLARRPDGAERTPLCYAAGAGQRQMAQLLIEFSAKDEHEAKWDGDSCALKWAILAKDLAMADFLLSRKVCDPDGGDWGTPFLYSAIAYDDDLPLATLLVKHGANVNIESRRGYRPIHDAAERGKLQVVQWLYEAGAELNPRLSEDRSPCGSGSTDGAHPIHLAVRTGATDVVKFLLDHGVSPLTRKDNGVPPLFEAVSFEHELTLAQRLAMVKLLLDRGADVNESDWAGRTVLDWVREARENGPPPDWKPIEELLVKHGAHAGDREAAEAIQEIRKAAKKLLNSLPLYDIAGQNRRRLTPIST